MEKTSLNVLIVGRLEETTLLSEVTTELTLERTRTGVMHL